jgi:plastocyanin
MVGLFGLNATTSANFNLAAHVAMGLALLGGFLLARRRWFTAHMICQSSVLLLNLPLIAFIMFPSYRDLVYPQVPGSLGDSFYWVASVHAVIGATAQLLGLWIILIAGLNEIDYRRGLKAKKEGREAPGGFDTGKIIPKRFRFRNYKPWMRTELTLWWIIVGLGIAVYIVWYRPAASSAKTGATGAHSFTIGFKNFEFSPKTITVSAGTRVTWVNDGGAHTVTSDANVFGSNTVNTGGRFSFTFAKPGRYAYHCQFHGATGGSGMAGVVIVKP